MEAGELIALRQAEAMAAAESFKHAQLQVEITQINSRMAQLNADLGPLQVVADNKDLTDRDRMVAAAFFVVMGQLPVIKAKPKEVEDVDTPMPGRESDADTTQEEGVEAQQEAAQEPEAGSADEAEGSEGSGESAGE